jgi:hypothetical protein
MPSVRVAAAIVVGVNALMAVWTARQYQRMLDYCAGFGRDGLECLGAHGNHHWQLWKAIGPELIVWVFLEVAVLTVLVAAFLNRPRPPSVVGPS